MLVLLNRVVFRSAWLAIKRGYLLSIDTVAHVADKHRCKIKWPCWWLQHHHVPLIVRCRKVELDFFEYLLICFASRRYGQCLLLAQLQIPLNEAHPRWMRSAARTDFYVGIEFPWTTHGCILDLQTQYRFLLTSSTSGRWLSSTFLAYSMQSWRRSPMGP